MGDDGVPTPRGMPSPRPPLVVWSEDASLHHFRDWTQLLFTQHFNADRALGLNLSFEYIVPCMEYREDSQGETVTSVCAPADVGALPVAVANFYGFIQTGDGGRGLQSVDAVLPGYASALQPLNSAALGPAELPIAFDDGAAEFQDLDEQIREMRAKIRRLEQLQREMEALEPALENMLENRVLLENMRARLENMLENIPFVLRARLTEV